jgi:polyisoprenoid-binding protein YceI
MKRWVLVAALVGTASTVQAQSAPPVNLTLAATSKVWLNGTSNVKDFRCETSAITSTISTRSVDGSAVPIASLVTKAHVIVPVAKLECGNGKMNEHMRSALKADKSPNLEFTLNSYTVEGTKAVLSGTLTIAGTKKDIQIPATIVEESGVVRVKATKQIDMTEWAVKPPSLMMGAMKVKQLVTIAFDVALNP